LTHAVVHIAHLLLIYNQYTEDANIYWLLILSVYIFSDVLVTAGCVISKKNVLHIIFIKDIETAVYQGMKNEYIFCTVMDYSRNYKKI
jgi:hypothetical protein